MKYSVVLKEVYNQPVEIEADSQEEAIKRVHNGEGKVMKDQLELYHTLSPECTEVYELKI